MRSLLFVLVFGFASLVSIGYGRGEPVDASTRASVRADLVRIAEDILRPSKLDSLPDTDPLRRRYEKAIDETLDALELELPDQPWAARAPYAATVFVFEYGESSWFTAPFGCKAGTTNCEHGVIKGTNDSGKACGKLQLHIDEVRAIGADWDALLAPWTCKLLRTDGTIAIRAGLRVVLRLEAQCGSLAAGWSAYAGSLGCKPYIDAVVRTRFKVAGVSTAR